jgi:hypothetical protein
VSCHVSCHSTGISDGRPASMCTHVWQKATTRSAERRPMSGLGTGNGRGKQKKNQRSSIRSPDHMSRVLRAAEGVVYVRGRAPATYLPRALRSLGAMAPRPGPRRARHRTTAPARGAMCCCWSVATPGRQQPAGMHAPTPYYVPTTRSRMHARTPVRAFFDRAPCAAHSHIPRRPVAARTHTYGTRLHVRTARACTYVRRHRNRGVVVADRDGVEWITSKQSS